jgi:hypothetical protein
MRRRSDATEAHQPSGTSLSSIAPANCSSRARRSVTRLGPVDGDLVWQRTGNGEVRHLLVDPLLARQHAPCELRNANLLPPGQR